MSVRRMSSVLSAGSEYSVEEEALLPSISSEEDYRLRWRSIRMMYLTMFLSSVGFSIVVPTLWSFLEEVGGSVTFQGWIVASYSLGQFIASPLFGAWSNRRRSIEPLAVSIAVNIAGNIMYCFSAAPHRHNDVYMLMARFVVGFGAGNVAVCRAYVSGATSVHERTGAMAHMSAAQGIGFIVGPALGAAFAPLKPGVRAGAFELDYLTGPGYLGAVFGVANFVLLVLLFTERRFDIAFDARGGLLRDVGSTSDDAFENEEDDDGIEAVRPPRFDRIAAGLCIFVFFVILFVFAVFETILSAFSMDMYGWSHQRTDLYTGILLACAGLLSVVTFMVAKPLSVRFGERRLLLAGLVIVSISFVAFVPFGPGSPRSCTKYAWCAHTPRLAFAQYVIATWLIAHGYPLASLCIYAIYSKVLGPAPQGIMMGALTSAGSAARALGPIYVSHVYEKIGPQPAFASIAAAVVVTAAVVLVFGRRLKPHRLFANSNAQ